MATAQLSFPAAKRTALDALLKEVPENHHHGEVRGRLGNTTQGTLVYFNSKNWIGHANFPPSVKSGEVVKFSANVPSKAGVVYSGQNQEGVECKWLLAFSVLGGAKPPKVYVEAGSNLNLDWEAIERQLDKSNDESYYVDPATGCTAAAKVIGEFVACTFGDKSV